MSTENKNWLDRPIHPALSGITNEMLLFGAILLVAIFTRFYDLDTRVMSHDESLHTYFSWLLYRGQGYEHTPMMHGPLQFHLLALTYFIFGVSDFTARIPAAVFSIATIWMVWYWRRYLGRSGALVAGLLLVVSPYMLYYGRYVRNEAFAGFSGILMLFAMLRYFETGGKRYLYLITTALILHFTSKETSFIYAAQALVFLGVYFIARVTRRPWPGNEAMFRSFLIALMIGLLLIGGALLNAAYQGAGDTLTGAETAMPANPDAPVTPHAMADSGNQITAILALLGILILAFAVWFLISGYSWHRLAEDRAFSLMMLTGTLILPLLVPLPLKMLEGWLKVGIPTTAAEVSTMMASPSSLLGLPRDLVVIGLLVILAFLLSALIGQAWNREWWKYAVFFWGSFTILFTAVFTNSDGFFTGLLGSLGYWIVQQGVQRGSQPWYFYVLVQIPVYEFLPAAGTLVACYLGFRRLSPVRDRSERLDADTSPVELEAEPAPASMHARFTDTFLLLLWWTVSSLIALSYAGERMPWLTYHITWPMILLTGWGVGLILDNLKLPSGQRRKTALQLLLTVLVIISLAISLASLASPTPPFQGKDLASLQATYAFLLPAGTLILGLAALGYLMRDELEGLLAPALFLIGLTGLTGTVVYALFMAVDQQSGVSNNVILLVISAITLLGGLAGLFLLARGRDLGPYPGLLTLTALGFLLVLTARAAFRAAYITYDSASEYLVYAHGAGPIKEVMSQAEEISRRTTGGLDMVLSYDASSPDTGVSWPFVWYLRDFTNQRAFDVPTRSIRESPFVIVDAKNFDKIEPALGPGYFRFDYIRMWWPNQDYFGLDRYRIAEALRNPQIRAGIWDIWMNRDYTRYAQATGHTDLTPTTWQPSDGMRLYLRQDIASMIWNYGAAPAETITIDDPAEGKHISLAADLIIDDTSLAPFSLDGPRALAFAQDGSLYVADSRNHQVVHLDANGNLLNSWGFFGDDLSSPAEPGAFNEPWGIAVGPDSSIYVSDTWNHRVQKFARDGTFLTAWGSYGTAEQADAFWGPRGLAIDSEGYVYVADTGNKRILVFDADGMYQAEFGTAGLGPGQFDEPVGIAIDASDRIYVTDTWNQRIQTFRISEDRTLFTPERQWDVYGWFGQSLDNKPFVAVGNSGHVFVTDPEQYRVIEYTDQGEVVRTWGDFGESPMTFGLTSGIAVDRLGRVWVSDPLYNRILRFTLP